jgi:hypothetical protein
MNAKENFLTPLFAEIAERLLFAKDISMYGANSRADEEPDGFDGTGVGAGLGAGDGDGAGLAALAVVMETEFD